MIPIAAILPTRDRVDSLAKTLRRLVQCNPAPAEILVHVGEDDAASRELLREQFPQLRVVVGENNTGPGGARNALLKACSHPWAASFDDDSHPIDLDFFAKAQTAIQSQPEAAVIACAIFERDAPPAPMEPPPASFHPCLEFANGGCLWSKAAFLQTRGHVPLRDAWCMEEQDVGLQLFVLGLRVSFAPHLRVYHDSFREHHNQGRVAAASLANTALLAFLRYPPVLWTAGLLQVLRRILWMNRNGRGGAILPGLKAIPSHCLEHRKERTPLPLAKVWLYLRLKRTLRPYAHGPGPGLLTGTATI